MKRSVTAWTLAAAVWTAGAAAGFRALMAYRATPGPAALAARSWPREAGVSRVSGRPVLVMLAHPRCPCSRASVGELAWVMGRAGGAADAHVFFVRPADVPEGWERGELWDAAAAIPGVSVHGDAAGAAAASFGAATSGQVMVYGGDGRLLYAGGITAGRGHAGGSAGRAAALSALSGRAGPALPAFGCALAAQDGGRAEEAWKL